MTKLAGTQKDVLKKAGFFRCLVCEDIAEYDNMDKRKKQRIICRKKECKKTYQRVSNYIRRKLKDEIS